MPAGTGYKIARGATVFAAGALPAVGAIAATSAFDDPGFTNRGPYDNPTAIGAAAGAVAGAGLVGAFYGRRAIGSAAMGVARNIPNMARGAGQGIANMGRGVAARAPGVAQSAGQAAVASAQRNFGPIGRGFGQAADTLERTAATGGAMIGVGGGLDRAGAQAISGFRQSPLFNTTIPAVATMGAAGGAGYLGYQGYQGIQEQNRQARLQRFQTSTMNLVQGMHNGRHR